MEKEKKQNEKRMGRISGKGEHVNEKNAREIIWESRRGEAARDEGKKEKWKEEKDEDEKKERATGRKIASRI